MFRGTAAGVRCKLNSLQLQSNMQGGVGEHPWECLSRESLTPGAVERRNCGGAEPYSLLYPSQESSRVHCLGSVCGKKGTMLQQNLMNVSTCNQKFLRQAPTFLILITLPPKLPQTSQRTKRGNFPGTGSKSLPVYGVLDLAVSGCLAIISTC
ncbi:hypothetical protein GN956_G21143 [Arapaima gigas]